LKPGAIREKVPSGLTGESGCLIFDQACLWNTPDLTKKNNVPLLFEEGQGWWRNLREM
jgi:hypothetical protein